MRPPGIGALAVDTAGLARSAWEAVASPSPLVDAGSRDFWNDGITATGGSTWRTS